MKVTRNIIKERTFVDPKDGLTKSRFGYRGQNKIAWIVIHYAGSTSARGRAKGINESMQTWKRSVSSHYQIGEDGIFQAVEERHCAWHCGGYKKENKCAASNATAIGIDLIERKGNSCTSSVNDCDWYFKDSVIDTGARFVAELADKYGIPMDHIIRHYDVTGKRCPRPFVGNDVNSITGETGEFAWNEFLMKVENYRSQDDVEA